MIYDATFRLVLCIYSRPDIEGNAQEAFGLVDGQQAYHREFETATLQARHKSYNGPRHHLGLHRTNCPPLSRPEELGGKLLSNEHVQQVDGPEWRLVQYNM